jgi:hypothetical protein
MMARVSIVNFPMLSQCRFKWMKSFKNIRKRVRCVESIADKGRIDANLEIGLCTEHLKMFNKLDRSKYEVATVQRCITFGPESAA